MTYYSKKAIVLFITEILVFVSFYPVVLKETSDINPLSSEAVKAWAAFFLILLVANILLNIVATILFKIIHSIFSKEKEPKIIDERDKFIELKAVRNFCFTFSFGFFASMIALIVNQPISSMFQILAYSFLLAGLILKVSYVFYYQREA